MPVMGTYVRVLIFAMGAVGAATATADESSSPWLMGMQLGSARGSDTAAEPSSNFSASGDPSTMNYDVTTTVGGKNRLGWRLFTGYRFTNYLALQVGYTDLGKVDTRFGDYPQPIPMPDDTSGAGAQSARGFDLGLQLKAPVTDRLSLSVRGGTYRWKLQQPASGVNAVSSNQRDSDAFYGAGAEISILPDLSGTVEWVRYEVAGEPIALWTVGVLYRLGGW